MIKSKATKLVDENSGLTQKNERKKNEIDFKIVVNVVLDDKRFIVT